MTVAELHAYVGAPRPGTEIRQRAIGLESVAWPARCDDRDGWWWVVTRGDDVLALGWTSEGDLRRDIIVAAALVAGQRGAPVLPC